MSLFTLPAVLERTVEEAASRTAVVHKQDRVTFEELRSAAVATAVVLREMGIRKGDRVGICMSKSIDQVVAILGVLYADAVFVPILPRLRRHNIAHIVGDCGMAVLVTDEPRLREVAELGSGVRILIGQGELREDLPCLPYLRRQVPATAPTFSCISADTAAIIYSSGSTGRPKGIVISHRNLYDGARIVAEYLGTHRDDRIVGVLSLHWDYGLNQLWQVLYTGCSLYLHDFMLPQDLFEFLARERITALPLMPVVISQMYEPRLYRANLALDLSSVRYISSSGGRVSERMLANLRTTFPDARVYLMYGLTEAFRSTFLPPEQLAQRPGSIGRAIPDVEILVLDAEGNLCPPGLPGELVHRGACVAKGYWNDPAASGERFRRIERFPGETVVFSGDIVKTDGDGYLYFIGRDDAMIKTRGFRVSPTEVEEVAERFEGVGACVAFGVNNIDVGQDIALAYTADGSRVSDAMFRNYLKANLPPHMVPRYLCALSEFRTTGNEGKIDRQHVMIESRAALGLDRA